MLRDSFCVLHRNKPEPVYHPWSSGFPSTKCYHIFGFVIPIVNCPTPTDSFDTICSKSLPIDKSQYDRDDQLGSRYSGFGLVWRGYIIKHGIEKRAVTARGLEGQIASKMCILPFRLMASRFESAGRSCQRNEPEGH